jgi:hypothetical protein
MSGRGSKYKSMGVSYREGQEQQGGGRGGGGRGRGRGNRYRKTLNGNYIKQGGDEGGGGGEERPQVRACVCDSRRPCVVCRAGRVCHERRHHCRKQCGHAAVQPLSRCTSAHMALRVRLCT